MMTGMYASALGCYDNATAFGSDVPTFAHYLAAEGYDTVLAGKMHFIGPDQLHGFRTRLTTDIYPASFAWIAEREPHIRRPDDRDETAVLATSYVTAGVREWSVGLAYDQEVQFRALEYLRSRRTATGNMVELHPDQPFLLCVSYHHPHDPFHVTQAMWDAYEGAEIELPKLPPGDLDTAYSSLDRWLNEWHGVPHVDLADPDVARALRRAYYALVTDIDSKLGELLNTLAENDLDRNTVVIFLSDHGDMLGERGMVQKRTFYEWSSRIPLVISFPEKWEGGRTVEAPVSLVDLHQTLCDIAEVKDVLPNDGQSLVSLLDGANDPGRIAIGESHADGIYAPSFMVRRGPYKLIEVHGHDRQLFDLEADPHEWRNLAGQPNLAAVERELLSELWARFDPDAIEAEIRASMARRVVVRNAARHNGTNWDYQPDFDARTQYFRFD
jgi:choline-sulfatase